MLAGAAGADEAVLSALEAFDLGVLESGPVRLLVFEPADIFLHDLFERNAFELLGARMSGDTHEFAPVEILELNHASALRKARSTMTPISVLR